MKSAPLKLGDKCPNCDGDFKAARVPTDEQRARFEDREIREPYPANTDTATVTQRKELGALYRCRDCGYETRFPLEQLEAAAAKAKSSPAAAAGNDSAHANS